jgi:hypothetical protein
MKGGRTQKQKQEKETFFYFNGLIIMRESALAALLLIIFSIVSFLWLFMTGRGHRYIYGRGTAFRKILLILCALQI